MIYLERQNNGIPEASQERRHTLYERTVTDTFTIIVFCGPQWNYERGEKNTTVYIEF